MSTTSVSAVPRPRYKDVHAKLASAQKPRRGQAYTVLVNRRLGRRVAAAAYIAGLTPNQVTVTSAAVSAAGIALLATGPVALPTALGVAALLVVGYALDSADGQLARLRGGGSLAGEWLDHTIDSAKIVALHLAVAVFLYRSDEMVDAEILIPLGYAVVAVVGFTATVLRERLIHGHDYAAAPRTDPQSLFSLLVRLPHDYGFLCLVFVLLAWPSLFLAVYTACLVYNALYVGAALVKWFGEIKSLDDAVTEAPSP